jgi:hypothetical protein
MNLLSVVCRPQVHKNFKLNMDLDLYSFFGLHVHSCTHWLGLTDQGFLPKYEAVPGPWLSCDGHYFGVTGSGQKHFAIEQHCISQGNISEITCTLYSLTKTPKPLYSCLKGTGSPVGLGNCGPVWTDMSQN